MPTSISLQALDHDVAQKGSIVPTVFLDVQIPEHMDESFYRGDVSITLKDAVFEPSSPNRFTTVLLE